MGVGGWTDNGFRETEGWSLSFGLRLRCFLHLVHRTTFTMQVPGLHTRPVPAGLGQAQECAWLASPLGDLDVDVQGPALRHTRLGGSDVADHWD